MLLFESCDEATAGKRLLVLAVNFEIAADLAVGQIDDPHHALPDPESNHGPFFTLTNLNFGQDRVWIFVFSGLELANRCVFISTIEIENQDGISLLLNRRHQAPHLFEGIVLVGDEDLDLFTIIASLRLGYCEALPIVGAAFGDIYRRPQLAYRGCCWALTERLGLWLRLRLWLRLGWRGGLGWLCRLRCLGSGSLGIILCNCSRLVRRGVLIFAVFLATSRSLNEQKNANYFNEIGSMNHGPQYPTKVFRARIFPSRFPQPVELRKWPYRTSYSTQASQAFANAGYFSA